MKKRETNREFGVGACVVVNEKAPGGYVARLATVLEMVLGSRYGVRFENPSEPTIYLDAECLDPAPQVRTNTLSAKHSSVSVNGPGGKH